MLILEDEEGNGRDLKGWIKESTIITNPLAEIVSLLIVSLFMAQLKTLSVAQIV
jgi:hypothetical protein